MKSSRQRLFVFELLAVCAPLALVMAGKVLLAGPPPSVMSVQVSAPAFMPAAAAPDKPIAPEQQRAEEWVRAVPTNTELVSPLNHPVETVVVKVEPVVDKVPEPLPPPPPRESPILGLRLTAVLGNEEGQLASINGHIFRIGQEVRPRLRLTAIDARNSSIELTADNDEKYFLKREQK